MVTLYTVGYLTLFIPRYTRLRISKSASGISKSNPYSALRTTHHQTIAFDTVPAVAVAARVTTAAALQTAAAMATF